MNTQQQLTDAPALPEPGTWVIDASHTEVAFVGRHLGLNRTRGRFTGVEGTIRIADDIAGSELDVTIAMNTVSSGLTARDDSLRSERIFDVDKYPTATFRSTAIAAAGGAGTITGDLTIRNITRTVVFDTTYHGQAADPLGTTRAAFHASTTIYRDEWNLAPELGFGVVDVLVSNDIRIEIDAEIVRA